METTVAPNSPAPDSAPRTIGQMFPANSVFGEASDLDAVQDVFEIAPADTELGAVERPKLMAIADRLLKHLATDEAEVDGITAAAALEVNLVTQRYQALAQKVSKRASWKRFCLEQLAALLFQDATSKSKSISLPYGTLGRRDFKGAPELVDEEAALQRCFADDRRDLIKLAIATTAEELEDVLVGIIRRCESGGIHEGAGLTLTQAVRGEVDNLIARGGDRREEGLPTVKVSLAWGALRKEPAVALFAAEKGGAPGGVKIGEPSTKYFAEITEAR